MKITFLLTVIHVKNPLNAKLNAICHLLTLLGAHHILCISRIRVNCIKRAVLTQLLRGGNFKECYGNM
jgi:hypothetical protein